MVTNNACKTCFEPGEIACRNCPAKEADKLEKLKYLVRSLLVEQEKDALDWNHIENLACELQLLAYCRRDNTDDMAQKVGEI